ncbi:ferredoxin [Nocardia sp. NPDC006044]|uniref:ferredoxin n=1 Tax=Nocardia sp. NPDC006044 TaxID=3364306 RepID=UPI0036C8938E
MRISADRDRCIGAGMCALLASGVFDQDAGDGKVRVLDPALSPESYGLLQQAAQACPAEAITVLDEHA